MPLNINSQSYPYMLYVLIARSRISTHDYEMYLESEFTYPGLADVSEYCCSVFASQEITSVLLQNRSQISQYISELNSLYAASNDSSIIDCLNQYQTQLDNQKSSIDSIQLNSQNLIKSQVEAVGNYVTKIKQYHDSLKMIIKSIFNHDDDFDSLEYWFKEIRTSKSQIIEQLKKNPCVPDGSAIFDHPKEALIVLLRQNFTNISQANDIVNGAMREFDQLKENFPDIQYDLQFDSLKSLEEAIQDYNSELVRIVEELESEMSKVASVESAEEENTVTPPALITVI